MSYGKHHHHFSEIIHLKTKLGKLFAHLIIQAFALSAISIFVPIYLLQIGFKLPTVFLFLFIQWSVYSLCAPIAGFIINKIGIKEVVLIRSVLIALALLILSAINHNHQLDGLHVVAGSLIGFASILYSLSIKALFAKFMHSKKKGRETGRFLGYTRVSSAVGPFIGGIVSMNFGFEMLAIIVSGIFFISTIPLLLIKTNINHPHFEFKRFRYYIRNNQKNFLYFSVYGIKRFIFFIVLPIALYLNQQSTLSLGATISAIALLNILSTMGLGTYVDKKDSKILFKVGSVVTAIFLFAIGSILKSDVLTYLSLISGIVSMMIDLPLESYIYSKAKRANEPIAYLGFKEFSMFFGRAILFITLILFSNNLEYSFYFAAASALVFRFF